MASLVSYLQIEGLTKSYGDRLLFGDVTFGVSEGDKIGLIAVNGTGKSTLLSIIAGREDADSGSVTFRSGIKVGYLEQDPPYDPEMTLHDYLLQDVAPDDWTAPDRAGAFLGKFGLHDTAAAMGTLSGGQVKRAALARVLLSEPQMLILDEPTNHLDIGMIEWLETYLSRSRMTLLMVTHDRYFLDKVCTRIIEIDREQIFTYEGNYDYYLQKRSERMEAMGAELAKVKNLLRTELDWMRRQPQARGSKAKYRIDNFHELERRSRVSLTERRVSLAVDSAYIGSKIFEAHGVCKSFGDKRILNDWNYTFARYEKVGIVGANGVGKSTFIKLLLGELPPDAGHFDVGQTVRWGYYSQEGMTDFDEGKKVIDAVREVTDAVRINDKTVLTASQFLSHFLFTPATQQKYIYKLSGGERRRLYLATVLMQNPNFLILDEPTNDLDIMTLAVLEDYLAAFGGCVIVVSHDRFFLDRIVDHLFVFEGDGVVRDFPGDYSTYRHCLEQREKEAREQKRLRDEEDARRQAARQGSSGDTRQKPRDRKGGLTFKEKREMEELEAMVEAMSAEKAQLEAGMSSGEMSVEELTSAGRRMEELIAGIDEAEMRLLELMEKESL